MPAWTVVTRDGTARHEVLAHESGLFGHVDLNKSGLSPSWSVAIAADHYQWGSPETLATGSVCLGHTGLTPKPHREYAVLVARALAEGAIEFLLRYTHPRLSLEHDAGMGHVRTPAAAVDVDVPLPCGEGCPPQAGGVGAVGGGP
jgi:hypothetical protein